MDSLSHFLTGDGVRIAYRSDGAADLPVLLLSNSIGTDLHMWDGQLALLTRRFRVLRYDARGHGASAVPAGPYSLDRLGRDALELLDALGLQRVHVLGLSLGGFVAQWLAIHVPERVERLVLSNTAAYLGAAANWEAAIRAVLQAPDMTETAETFLRNWFPRAWLESAESVVEDFRQTLLATRNEGIAGSWAAIRDADLRRTIRLIEQPTLVIAGAHDTVTTAAHAEEIAAAIPQARLRVLPTVHLANVERPQEFVELVQGFLLGEW
ncbi:MAG TPA: 3-oxoadipate enol-lactonase [Pseudomonas sp.]|nr:3-oxoadipate enol-lactonase [Pseudomonas sp.]